MRPQCRIGHGTQRTQRMVLRYSLLRADIAKDIQLLFVLPRISSSYQGVWKQEGFPVHQFTTRGPPAAT
jgi:hypothetical protein